MTEIKATLGFVFNPDLSRVLLIEKNRPQWQRGQVNGLGGKYEDGETANECVAREIKEESGLKIPPLRWKQVALLKWKEWSVDVLASKYKGDPKKARSLTDEPVIWAPVNKLPARTKTNLTWLVPLSIDVLQGKQIQVIIVDYLD